MGEISIWRAVTPSVVVLSIMIGIARITSELAGIDGTVLVPAYLLPSICVTLASILIWAAVELARLAIIRADRPAMAILSRLRSALPMLALPVMVQPLFMAAFTTAKTAIAPLESFTWDAQFAKLDMMIFGVDPWRLTFDLIGPGESRMLELLYTAGWGLGLVFIQALVALAASRWFVGRFFLATNLCWLIGGIALAYAMPAAGPVFAHLFDPALVGRFGELQGALNSHLLVDGPILRTQAYLVASLGTPDVEVGGGISAMPSVHVTVAILYILAARGTRWYAAAIVFAVLTLVGSVHFGYHYAVDGVVAAAVAMLCWTASTLHFRAGTYLQSVRAPAPLMPASLSLIVEEE